MLTTNDLLTFFHVLMELTDAEVKISHVDPDDGLVELRIGGEGHQGLWLPAPAAAERIKDFLRFHYAEEDQHENLLEYLLHKSPVTTCDILAYIKVMPRLVKAGIRIVDLNEITDEVEVGNKADRCWMATANVAHALSVQFTEVQNGS